MKINQYVAEHHHFLLHTVAKNTACQLCARPLLGIIHQGTQCQKCGLITHRRCSSLGLPQCMSPSPASAHSLSRHHIFGVSLFDLVATNQTSTALFVPLFLVKTLRHIEITAQATGDDLYDVYRLSSDTVELEPIRQQINESGIELVNLGKIK